MSSTQARTRLPCSSSWPASWPSHYLPLFHLVGAGMAITMIVHVRWALVGIPVFAAMEALVRVPAIGVGHAIAESLLLLLSGFIATAGVVLLNRANRTVVSAVSAKVALEKGARRASLRAFERECWDGLIHDKVLGALRIAGRSRAGPVPLAAQGLASQALAAFRGQPRPPTPAPNRAWAALVEHLELDADIRVTGRLKDQDVAEILIQAAGEAITNVARHSGQQKVSVVADLDDNESQVVIHDPGRGFPVSPDVLGTGLRISVIGRMSSPSNGGNSTAVGLGWPLTWAFAVVS